MTPVASFPGSFTVSIIIPCFNAEGTIGETIKSALAQAEAFEVIVVDDGSTDLSAEVIRSFGDQVRAVFGPNRGVSAARNTGMSLATGEWIVFVDSDDLLTPGTLALRLHAADAHAADVVFCDWQEFSDEGEGLALGSTKSVDRKALAENAERALAGDVWAPPVAVLYRAALVGKIGGFRADLPVIQDARFLFDAAFHGARFGHSEHIGARYRIVPDSLSRRSPSRFWRDVLLNGQQIEALWRGRAPLNPKQEGVLDHIYGFSARILFGLDDPQFFIAIQARRRLKAGRMPLHSRVSAFLARCVGIRNARRLLSLAGKT